MGVPENPSGRAGGTGRLGEIKIGSTDPEGGRAPMHRPYLFPSRVSRITPISLKGALKWNPMDGVKRWREER